VCVCERARVRLQSPYTASARDTVGTRQYWQKRKIILRSMASNLTPCLLSGVLLALRLVAFALEPCVLAPSPLSLVFARGSVLTIVPSAPSDSLAPVARRVALPPLTLPPPPSGANKSRVHVGMFERKAPEEVCFDVHTPFPRSTVVRRFTRKCWKAAQGAMEFVFIC